MPLFVTLSSIPPRFPKLARTLKSLMAQQRRPDGILLCIPLHYPRFPDWDGTLPEVPPGVEILRCDEDFGPATKILPAVRAFAGTSTELLLCDDDRIYDRLWTERFVRARAKQPDSVIAEAGRFVPHHTHTTLPHALPRIKGWKYRTLRALTLGQHKPLSWIRSGHVDIFKGYGGAMLRPDFLTEAAFRIPAHLRSVDDPWLSGQFAVNGIPIWLNADGRHPAEQSGGRVAPLLKARHDGLDRGNANKACIDWYREHHGIWA